jgi:hypothetical protein
MTLINRAVMLVTPKAPHLTWMKSVAPDFDGDPGERTAYLIPEYETPDEVEEILGQVWEFIFEEELESWDRLPSNWPAPRTLAMFREHFDIEVCSIVEDLCEWEIERDSFGDDAE